MEARGVIEMEVKEKKDVVPDSAYKDALQRSIQRYGPGLEGSPLINEFRAFVGSNNGKASGAIASKQPLPGPLMKK